MSGKTAKTLPEWAKFVLEHGFRAPVHYLAAVVGQSEADVQRVRQTGACRRLDKGKGFGELFSLWHGREPAEGDWPVPRKQGSHGTYEWQAPEDALLATLVGNAGTTEIAAILTARLRTITGDESAERTRISVQVRTNQIGLQTRDVLGGITPADAGREIGSTAIIYQAIDKKQLVPRRNGRYWVIPHDQWQAWKAKRVFPPKGYVMLASIKEALAVRSDKLSEFARMGLIPTARRCNPYGTKGPSTQFGTWWIDKKVADKMVADRRAGRPMPWHGAPLLDNLRVTYRKWQARKHPANCATCKDIWGRKGAPKDFEDFVQRYPSLAHGAKRHLTREWSPGLTIREVAEYVARSTAHVKLAIGNGMLKARTEGRNQYVSRTDATLWKARRCPAGDSVRSWLALDTACKQYLFTRRELQAHIAAGRLKSRTGTQGAMRDVVYVSKHQCAQLRQTLGFSEEEAARRARVSVPRLRELLEGVNWRKAKRIPLPTLQAVIKRIESRHGFTIEEAAARAGETPAWVKARIADGTIKVSRAKWDRRRLYVSEPMMNRLLATKARPARRKPLGEDWLRQSEAAVEAGVCATTLIRWAEEGGLARRQANNGWRYHRQAVRAHARRYWRTARFLRAKRPAWLLEEAARM